MNDKFELLIMGQQFKKLYEKCYGRLMGEYELKKIDIDVLYFLSHSGKYDTAKDIASLIYVSKAHVSKSIESLHKKGLIELLSDSFDRRYVHIRISPSGCNVVDEIKSIKQKIGSILFRGIAEKEKEYILQLGEKIAANINEELEKDG